MTCKRGRDVLSPVFADQNPPGPTDEAVTPAELAALLKSDMQQWGPIIQGGEHQGRIVALVHAERQRHETSPPTISASGSGRCRAAGGIAGCQGASLSVAPGAYCCWLSSQRTLAGPMALGPARPTLRHRESTGRKQFDRYGACRECAAGRLY